MNKILVAILLLLLSSQIMAKDFRVVDFGDKCNVVPSREREMGSRLIGEARLEYQRYEGIYLDRAAKIFYDCGDNNQFVAGTYFYTFASLEEAKSFFELAKQLLISEFGVPKIDASLPEYINAISKLGMESTEDKKYSVSWVKDRKTIFLSVTKPSVHSKEAAVGISFKSDQK